MKRMNRRCVQWAATVAAAALLAPEAWGQCAMCRATLEGAGDAWMIEGIRRGVYLLLAAPAAIGGLFGYRIYRALRDQDSRVRNDSQAPMHDGERRERPVT